VRFDNHSYDKITEYSAAEHRGFGDFVRHATLCYIENLEKTCGVNEKELEGIAV